MEPYFIKNTEALQLAALFLDAIRAYMIVLAGSGVFHNLS